LPLLGPNTVWLYKGSLITGNPKNRKSNNQLKNAREPKQISKFANKYSLVGQK
jgi:hypothetical protein